MELSQFIKQDIISFLDKKAGEIKEEFHKIRAEEFNIINLERDYARETREALEEDNIHKAKHIFHELRKAYNETDLQDPLRENIYGILKEVYAIIEEKLAGEHEGTALGEEINIVTQKGLRQALDDKSLSQVEGAKISVEQARFEHEAFQEQKMREKDEQELQKALYHVNEAMNQDDIAGAIKAYKKLKEAFQDYPVDDKFRKIEWYNKVLTAYELIKQRYERRKEEVAEAASRPTPPDMDTMLKQLAETKAKIKTIIETLDKGDLHGAEDLLIDARHLAASLDDEHVKEKGVVEHILSVITSRIQFLKRNPQTPAPNQQTTMQTPTETNAEMTSTISPKEEILPDEEPPTMESEEDTERVYRTAVSYQHQGKHQQAKKLYHHILKQDPEHLPSQIRLRQLNEN